MTLSIPAATVTTALPRRKSPRRRGHALVVVAATLIGVVALAPLGFILWVLATTGWETASDLIFRPRVGELLVNTVLLEVCVLPLAIGLAVAIAWLVERTDLPGRRLWAWLAMAPLAIPAFVHSYAWNGAFPLLHGLLPAVLISVFAYFPFVYLPVAAQLRRLDPAVEDAGASLGMAPVRVFFRLILPQLRFSILGGALLVGLHLLGEYGVFALIRYDTFTTAIVDQFQSIYNGPAANMLGIVLVLCSIALLGIEGLGRGRERYARVGSGSARRPRRYALGKATLPTLLVPVLMTAFAIGIPVVTLGRWLSIGGFAAWQTPYLGSALYQTAFYAVAGAILATLAALPIAWLSVRAPGRFQRFLEGTHYYVGALPGVIVALALVTITIRIAHPLYQTVITVLLAYVILFLPRAIVGLRASIAQVPVELEQAAMSLGRSPWRAVLQTTMRLAAPGFAASLALVALGVTTELTGTLMLSPSGTHTLATQFWALTSEIDYVAAAPFALLMILLSMPLLFLLRTQARRTVGE